MDIVGKRSEINYSREILRFYNFFHEMKFQILELPTSHKIGFRNYETRYECGSVKS